MRALAAIVLLTAGTAYAGDNEITYGGWDRALRAPSADATTGFKPGSTNQTEVVAALGKPIHTIQEADGSKIDQYPAEAGAKSGSGFVPDWMGGESTGGAYSMLSFEYSAGGILKDIKTGK